MAYGKAAIVILIDGVTYQLKYTVVSAGYIFKPVIIKEDTKDNEIV